MFFTLCNTDVVMKMFVRFWHMNRNATKHTFGHADVTGINGKKAGKSCNKCFRNNTVFVMFEHSAIKKSSFRTYFFSIHGVICPCLSFL